MSQRKNVSISLSTELHAVVERMLVSGRYGNFSEVVRAALRLLDERERHYTDFQTIPQPQSGVSLKGRSAHD